MSESALLLSEAARAELAAFAHRAEVGSTQDWAAAEALPARGCAVYLADRQTAGRGRRGRVWHTEPGGALAFTVARRFALPPRALPPLALVAGLAVAEGLHARGAPAVRLKWPNDLLLEGAKLGGLLVEGREGGALVGLGLNLRLGAAGGSAGEGAAVGAAPEALPRTDLAAAGVSAAAPVVLAAVLEALLPALARFEREGFAPFHAQWPRFDALAGRRVRLLAGDAVLEGEVLGLAADGGLRVRHAEGERVHHAGEVSLRVAA